MKPLEGLRVIDLTQAMAAPYCTMNLADLGADVIKVEPPGGEEQRRGSTSRNGHSGSFMAINRNKRGITLDLKTPEGVEVMHRLIRTADVFVQNYRPGAAGRLRVDYDTLRALNPRLIYCSVSGFGSTGPYASRGGYDLIAQGMSGIISVTGEEDGAPAKAGIPVSDLAAGLFGAYGVLCAVEHREKTGEGQFVDTSLLEAAMALTVWESTEHWTTGRTPKALGSAHRLSAPYQALRASDGWFTVGAANDKLFDGFCRALGRPDLLDDPRFAGRAQRLEHRHALAAEIDKTTAKEPRAHWLGSSSPPACRAVRSTPTPRRSTTPTRSRAAWSWISCTRAPAPSRRSACPCTCRRRPAPSIAPRRCSASTTTRSSPSSATTPPRASACATRA